MVLRRYCRIPAKQPSFGHSAWIHECRFYCLLWFEKECSFEWMVLFTSDRYNTGKISFGHDWIPSFAMYSFVSAIRDNRAGCWPHALIPLNPLVIWHSLAGSEVNRCNDSIIRVVTFLYRRIGNEKATVYFQSIARKYRISNNLSQDTKNFEQVSLLKYKIVFRDCRTISE